MCNNTKEFKMVSVLRQVITDKVCIEFNWDGRSGKKALKEIEPFRNIFFGKKLI